MSSFGSTNGPRRNMVFLLTDQHRLDTLGCYGNPWGTSPNIDSLASSGTLFRNAFTPTAICTPARATLLTGLLPFRHRLLANYERNVGYAEELAGEVPFSTELREAGYQCGLIGKWHVGQRRGPQDYGFEGTHFPGWHNPVDHPEYRAWLDRRGLPAHRVLSEVRGVFPNGQPGNLLAGVLSQPTEATFEHFLADSAIEMMRRYASDWRRSGRPFYLACHFFGPHLPYLVPEEVYFRFDPETVVLPRSMLETFDGKPVVQRHYSDHWCFDSFSPDEWRRLIAVYWGYVALIDAEIGRILDVARDLELFDDTVFMFSSDHGEFTGAHRLNDKGPAMYDDIYRIPLVVRAPGGVGGSNDAFVTLTDLSATFLDVAGVEVPKRYDGRSLVPTVSGSAGEDDPREVVAEFHGHHFPYPQRMLRTEHWKLVVNPAGVNELYDLDRDPDELANCYRHRELADTRAQLETRLYQVLRDRGDNFYHWMTSMNDVGGLSYDPSLASFAPTRGHSA